MISGSTSEFILARIQAGRLAFALAISVSISRTRVLRMSIGEAEIRSIACGTPVPVM